MKKLYDRFTAGSRQDIDFVYTGYHVSQEKDFSIILNQHDYIDNISVEKMAASKQTDKQLPLTKDEQSHYRSLVGKLGWIVQGTRPDLAFSWLEASTKNNSATVDDMLNVGKKLLSAKMSKGTIFFQNLGDYKNWVIVCFSDAAHANICDATGSTGGSVVFLMGEDNKCCPLSWKSTKLRRVCRSSAAAEGMSLSECIDEGIYFRQILCQLLGVDKDVIRVIAYTDHEGLRSNISSVLHPKVLDKRLKIEIANIRQNIRSGEINEIIWCSSDAQLADCLTKRGASGIKLLSVLQSGCFPRTN